MKFPISSASESLVNIVCYSKLRIDWLIESNSFASEKLFKWDLELIGVDESVALDRGRWRKIIASPTPYKGKIFTLNENDDDDDDDDEWKQ